jgi:hypothetical protein
MTEWAFARRGSTSRWTEDPSPEGTSRKAGASALGGIGIWALTPCRRATQATGVEDRSFPAPNRPTRGQS